MLKDKISLKRKRHSYFFSQCSYGREELRFYNFNVVGPIDHNTTNMSVKIKITEQFDITLYKNTNECFMDYKDVEFETDIYKMYGELAFALQEVLFKEG